MRVTHHLGDRTHNTHCTSHCSDKTPRQPSSAKMLSAVSSLPSPSPASLHRSPSSCVSPFLGSSPDVRVQIPTSPLTKCVSSRAASFYAPRSGFLVCKTGTHLPHGREADETTHGKSLKHFPAHSKYPARASLVVTRPRPWGNLFRTPQWTPETTDSTQPYRRRVFPSPYTLR